MLRRARARARCIARGLYRGLGGRRLGGDRGAFRLLGGRALGLLGSVRGRRRGNGGGFGLLAGGTLGPLGGGRGRRRGDGGAFGLLAGGALGLLGSGRGRRRGHGSACGFFLGRGGSRYRFVGGAGVTRRPHIDFNRRRCGGQPGGEQRGSRWRCAAQRGEQERTRCCAAGSFLLVLLGWAAAIFAANVLAQIGRRHGERNERIDGALRRHQPRQRIGAKAALEELRRLGGAHG